MPLLEIKDLHVTVGERPILNGLDLVVNKGEVHAIMGPNGSGKSTLAHVLAGKSDYVVTGGSVTLDGEDLLAMAIEMGGTISGEHGVGVLKNGWLRKQWAPAAVAAHEAVKDALDPSGMFNPGKKVP